jgi:hypothetical protein
MHLSIIRGGGLAGITTKTELSSDDLSPEDATALREKVERAGLVDAQEPPAPGPPSPDELSYEFTVEDEGVHRTVRMTDSTMPEKVQSLLAWVDSLPGR